MSLVVKRTAAAGGADATQTTAAGIWTQFDALLLAAGWTVAYDHSLGIIPWTTATPYASGDLVEVATRRYQAIQAGTSGVSGPTGFGQYIIDGDVIWRFLTSAGAGDKIYTSTGESGTQKLFCRANHSTHVTPAVFNLYFYQYFNATTEFGYNRIGPATSGLGQFTYTAGNTINYAMVADKDSFSAITNDSANNRRIWAGGNLKRHPGTSDVFFTSNASVSAGALRTFNFSSGNPVASGYKVGDPVFIVSQQTTGPAAFIIPIYSAYITAVTTTSITIDYAQATTDAGAFVGADPQPTFYFDNNTNATPASSGFVYTAYRFIKWNNSNQGPVNLYLEGATDIGFATLGIRSLIATANTELDPNNRTGRVGLGEYSVCSTDNEICGIVPKYFHNPRTSDALWAIGRSTKTSTVYDYVTFPANTATPASQARDAVGPIAMSGGSSYVADIYTPDFNFWVEGELLDTQEDHARAMFTQASEGGDAFVAVQVAANEADVIPEGVLNSTDTDRANVGGDASPKGLGAETFPFDTGGVTTTGGGSGFNSGIN